MTDPDRDCRAVLKVLRPDRADEPHVVAALRTEGALLTTLAHPHLVRGYEVLTHPTAVLLETLPGRTLAALVDDGPLGVHDTALVGRQLASALGYLHRHGWLHLDVKPENVVVQEGRVVLIDLGLATRPGRLERSVGTEGYAAPEQDAGCTVGPATDVWGLGVTLAECLEGRDAGSADRARRRLLPHRPRRAGLGRRGRRPARRRPRGAAAAQLVEIPATAMIDHDHQEHQREADEHGADDAEDPAGHRGGAAAVHLRVGVDLVDRALAHHPGERRDQLAQEQPDDAEDQRGHRPRVVLGRPRAVGRRTAVGTRRLRPVGAGLRRLRRRLLGPARVAAVRHLGRLLGRLLRLPGGLLAGVGGLGHAQILPPRPPDETTRRNCSRLHP